MHKLTLKIKVHNKEQDQVQEILRVEVTQCDPQDPTVGSLQIKYQNLTLDGSDFGSKLN